MNKNFMLLSRFQCGSVTSINLTKKKLLAVSTVCAITQLLTGCGGTGQDKPDNKVSAVTQVTLAGVAIDGHLARATVFLDTNNNSTRDPWENYAFTDNDGYFSKNPITNTDYCASNATKELNQYCLKMPDNLVSVVLRIEGGYDIVTGEPFFGQMSRRINLDAKTSISSTITPLTTLLTYATTGAERAQLLRSLGLTESDLDVDYLNATTPENLKLLATSLKIHKVVSLLSDRLMDTYSEIGEEFGTPNDATSIVYQNAAREMMNTSASLSDMIKDEKTLIRILDSSEKELRAIYVTNEITLPNDLGDSNNPNGFKRVSEVSSHIDEIVDALIPKTAASDKAQVTGGMRALETVVLKTTSEEQTQDKTLDNAIAFFTNKEKKDLVDAFRDGLGADNVDLSGVSRNTFSPDELSTPEKILAVTQIPDNISPFSRLGGYRIKVSDPDLGTAPNNLKDDEIEFYFKGNASTFDGEYSACAKHIKDAKSDGSLGEGNTKGQLITGFWSLLGASTNNPKSYSLLLTIKFLGATYQAIMKPSGVETTANQKMQLLRFDNGGKFIVWNSLEGFAANNTFPTTDAECELRLPSRVGL
jgi:hypothetical protein